MNRTSRAVGLITCTLLWAAAGCASSPQQADLNGTWSVDLSPNQDGSDVRSVTMAMDPSNQYNVTASTFSGNAYGSSFSNGQVMNHEGKTVFSFATNDQSGTSHWLGGMTSDGGMQGTVRSPDGNITRWSAVPSDDSDDD